MTIAVAGGAGSGDDVQGAHLLIDIGRVPKVVTAGVLGESSIYTDSGGNVGIGHAPGGSYPLDVLGSIIASLNAVAGGFVDAAGGFKVSETPGLTAIITITYVTSVSKKTATFGVSGGGGGSVTIGGTTYPVSGGGGGSVTVTDLVDEVITRTLILTFTGGILTAFTII